MPSTWTYRDWRLGGERTTTGDVTFDSTIHCGAGQAFREPDPGHYLCRSRAGLEPYAWRLHFCIESPGDGREITVEAADFNHFGQELWQEQAAVVSHDGEQWGDLGLDRVRVDATVCRAFRGDTFHLRGEVLSLAVVPLAEVAKLLLEIAL